MISLVIEAFYAVVFLQSFVTYLRHRDPVRRDLMLVFVPVTSLLVAEVVRRASGVRELPAVVGYVAVTALLAQPYLTMRLVRTLRPVPRWAMRLVLGTFLATTVAFYLLIDRSATLVTMAAVAAFFLVQGAAATLLVGEARRRTGAPRARLALAGVSTAALGLGLLVVGVGDSAHRAAPAMALGGQILALLSGVGYVVAFVPPRWLRRVWAGGVAYQVHHQMALAPADETPAETWQRYAMTVRGASGADAAVVLLPAPAGPEIVGPEIVGPEIVGLDCVAASGDVPDGTLATTALDMVELLDRTQPVTVPAESGSPLLRYARRAGARVLIAVPLQLPSAERGALVLLSRRQPMFVEDDARLLGDLGAQAAILAQRGAASEAIRTVNAELEQRVQARTVELRVAQAALEDVNHQLEAQNAMLARSNEELQRFAYVASHDLQEPLRKIISFSGLLVERMPDDLGADPAMYVDRIVGSASRMKRLIEDLLMFSRVGGAVELRPVDCDLALRAVLDSLAVAVGETGAVVTHDPLPTILTNRTSIEQLFQNLIGNALKYRSDAQPRVHVAAEQLDDSWRLTVTDNGIGIDMSYAERIFQVFQRLHARGQYEGTGIGLAVCKRIVESCGGRIGVDSTPGAGSTFWFTLPAAQTQPIEEPSDAVVKVAG
jgi:signal transduction histidine kinase